MASTGQIVNHAHCEVCGRVVEVGQRVCSPECQTKLDEAQRIKKRSAILIVLMVLFVLLLPNVAQYLR